MSFKLIDNQLAPAEGEVTIRTYHCTRLSPVFAIIGLKRSGYLTITNKRVVFFATGSSLFGVAGNSKLYNEVPIADVANLSLGQGTRFSFLRLIGALIVSTLVGGIILAVQDKVLPLLGFRDMSNPYILRLGICLQLIVAVWLFLRSWWSSREDGFRFLFASCGLSLLGSIIDYASTHKGSVESLSRPYFIGMAIFSFAAACYWLWCLYWFIRREYLTMTISSKSGFAKPIKIFGVSWWGRSNHSADHASRMAPAVDADIMFKELGAIVTDIQTLGEHGIEKWMQVKPDVSRVEEDQKRRSVAYHDIAVPCAMAAILLIGIFVGGESVWYSMGAKKALALKLRNELAGVRKIAKSDKSIQEWVPKMWASAEQEADAGEADFGKNKFGSSISHWSEAIQSYHSMSNAAVAMKGEFAARSKCDAQLTGVYVQESVSERLKGGILATNFVALMNQHPSSNDDWRLVGIHTTKARAEAEQDKWDRSGMAWAYATEKLFPALQLMRADLCVSRADLWVSLAEQAIKKGNAREASECVANAFKEVPSYPRAKQRQEVAWNMMRYSQLLIYEVKKGSVSATDKESFVKQLDLYGGADWTAVKSLVEEAKTLSNQNEWEKCNSAWKEASNKLPVIILAMQMENLETEARRGNWPVVSSLAAYVLSEYPDNQRASTLKIKADSIQSAGIAEATYQEAFSNALTCEVASNDVKLGDMSDFTAYMDRYGHEEWGQVKETLENARRLRCEERGAESSNEWMKACAMLPSAVQRMRAEIWMERAKQEVKSNNWAKVLVYAENALKEKPDHIKAMQLRDKADGIEEMRFMRGKYEQVFKDASGQMTDLGCKTNDQNTFVAYLMQYGGTAWEAARSNVDKATEYEKQGRHTECVASWTAALDTFQLAIRRTRSAYWLTKAEKDAKDKMWAKVSIETEKALVEDPDNERAKTLKSEAEKNSR